MFMKEMKLPPPQSTAKAKDALFLFSHLHRNDVLDVGRKNLNHLQKAAQKSKCPQTG